LGKRRLGDLEISFSAKLNFPIQSGILKYRETVKSSSEIK